MPPKPWNTDPVSQAQPQPFTTSPLDYTNYNTVLYNPPQITPNFNFGSVESFISSSLNSLNATTQKISTFTYQINMSLNAIWTAFSAISCLFAALKETQDRLLPSSIGKSSRRSLNIKLILKIAVLTGAAYFLVKRLLNSKKNLVIAIHAYNPSPTDLGSSDSFLALQPGKEYIQLKEDEMGWTLLRDPNSGKEGYAPTSFIRSFDSKL